jgi:hypothetical protein
MGQASVCPGYRLFSGGDKILLTGTVADAVGRSRAIFADESRTERDCESILVRALSTQRWEARCYDV